MFSLSCFLFITLAASPGARADTPILLRLSVGETLDGDGLPARPELKGALQAQGVSSVERLFPNPNPRNPTSFRQLGLDRIYRVKLGPDAGERSSLVQALQRTPGVESMTMDSMGRGGGAPGDPFFELQWNFSNDGSFSDTAQAGADVEAIEAWEMAAAGGSVLIAVLDTGIGRGERDIRDRIWTNTAEEAGNGRDDDSNGYVDDTWGWDFSYGDPDPDDTYGHGSNVAGIIGAQSDNGIGYAGACPSCQIMALKTLDDDNYGYYSWWAEAIVYAVDQGARVINISAGGPGDDDILRDAVRYARSEDVAVVACMMNEDDDTPYYPAAFDYVIAVGATDEADRRASPFFWGGGSNYGDHIDLSAPGSLIYGLSPYAGEYSWYWGGSSQAAPHVAALAGLLLSMDPALDPEELLEAMIAGAEDEVGRASEDASGWDPYHGWGRINFANSLRYLEESGGHHEDTDGVADSADGGGFPKSGGSCACSSAGSLPAGLPWVLVSLIGLLRRRR